MSSSLNKELDELRAAAGGPGSTNTFEPSSAANEPNLGPDSFTQALGSRANVNDPKTAAPQRKWFVGLAVLLAVLAIIWVRHSNISDARAAAQKKATADSLARLRAGRGDGIGVSLDEGDLNLDEASRQRLRALRDSIYQDSVARANPDQGQPPSVAPLAGSLNLDLEPTGGDDTLPVLAGPEASGGSAGAEADLIGEYRPVQGSGIDLGAPVGPYGESFAMPVPETPEEREARIRQERADSVRAAREMQIAQLSAETERLKQSGTRVSGAENAEGREPSVGVGADAIEAPGGIAGFAGMGGAQSSLASQVPPGTQVAAVLTQPFSSLTADVSVVQARLTASLRGRDGSVILPRGTVGYAQTSVREAANGGTPRVVLTFTTWVTPDQKSINGLTGMGQSMTSNLIGLEGRVNRRLLARTAKALVATAAAVATTYGQDEQISALGQPSAAQQTRIDMSNRMIGLAEQQMGGDERSLQNEVLLDAGTPLNIVFNLPGRGSGL